MATPRQDNDIDEQQFFELLNLFPIVRSSSYCEDDEHSKQSSPTASHAEKPSMSDLTLPGVNLQDSQTQSLAGSRNQNFQKREDNFWPRLKAVVEQKLGPAEAARFCDAFKQVHKSLVHEMLSSEAIGRISKNLEQRMKL